MPNTSHDHADYVCMFCGNSPLDDDLPLVEVYDDRNRPAFVCIPCEDWWNRQHAPASGSAILDLIETLKRQPKPLPTDYP